MHTLVILYAKYTTADAMMSAAAIETRENRANASCVPRSMYCSSSIPTF